MSYPECMWRDIPGTDGKYQISRNGDVRHIWPSGHVSYVNPYMKISKAGRDHGDRLYINLRINGKQVCKVLFAVMCRTWLGEPPEGMTWYHRNGNQHDNSIENAALIDRRELGRITGGRSMRRAVEMVAPDGNVVELYTSAREAAAANHMSLACVTDRCEGRIKKPFALNGYTFRWEEQARRRKKRRRPT